jgi:general stress protein 26
MHNEQAIQLAIAEVAALIEGTDVVMFTTRNAEGRLVSRPLAARKTPFDGGAWFLTALDSRKIGELKADPRVNLAYVNASNGAYVSIDGRAHVSVDRAQIAALWSDAIDALFFPAGKDDPNLAALRVEADTVEAWTSASTAVGRAFDFVKAKLTGDSAALGTQRHFDLRTGLRTTTNR